MPIDCELLKILACPACRGELTPVRPACGPCEEPGENGNSEPEGLVCAACAAVYPVRNSIPVMLREEAVPLEDWRRGIRARIKK